MKTLATYLFIDLFIALPVAFAMIRAKRQEEGVGRTTVPTRSPPAPLVTAAWIFICVLWPLWISLFAITSLLFPDGDDP